MRCPERHRRRGSAAFLTLALILGLAGACGGPGSEPPEHAPPPGSRGWTRAFLEPALLIADEVTIEGPDDLLEHVATRQDPGNTDYETRTTEEGLRQETRVRAGRSGVEIRAQLDGLEIVALRRLVVLQRPGEVAVTVRARGEAYWSRLDGSDERRGESLELSGRRGL